MTHLSVLWRRLDQPGHDAARLCRELSGWRLVGTAVFIEADKPCRLDYEIVADTEWRTHSGRIQGWLGTEEITVDIRADDARNWWLNGSACPQVAGCDDLDISFSPSTNLLAIRRSALAIGAEAQVRAAWFRFPERVLETLEQSYRRTTDDLYHYKVIGGDFVTDLRVNPEGFILEYPGLWQQEESITS